ncbi:MAG: ATP-binding protein [Treponema sp.]|nr:ATP-binding protein [Treponema sp.]
MNENIKDQTPSIEELQKEISKLKRKCALAEVNLARAQQATVLQERVESILSNSLKKELQFFNLILDNITNVLLLLDFDGRFAYASRTFLRDMDIASFGLISGRHYEEVMRSLIAEETIAKFTEAFNTAVSQKKTISLEEQIDIRQKGQPRIFSIFVTPMFDKNSNNAGIMMLINDITELKAMHNEMRRIEIAEESSKAKSKFLARMSHEIRTPMNAILGITEIQLQDESLTPDKEEAFGRIYNSGNALLRIINDILDLSKIEAGKLELITDRYEIASLLNDTAQLNMVRIGSKPIEFKLEADENIPSALLGDELRIKQILNNLLSNAFKYTEHGSVELAVSAESRNETENADVTLVFRVSDTGQGMSPEQVRELFDEYTRFNHEANRNIEGAGLGMSITQHLIKMMNGEISVNSEPFKGSTFTVHLPQKDVCSGALGMEASENLKFFRMRHVMQLKNTRFARKQMPRVSVLVVDDVDTNLYVARGLMVPYGISVDTVISGQEAINKLKSGSVYDIIFMDHMMPQMDGIEATAKIRQMDNTNSYFQNVPIVALTANAVAGTKEMFLKSGFNDYLSKPIDILELNTILEKWIPKEKQEEAENDATLHDLNRYSDKNGNIEITGVDTKKGILMSGGSLKSYLNILSVFREDVRKKIVEIKAALEKNDLPLYSIYVHALKSAAANIGAEDLSKSAAALETAARQRDMEFILAHNEKNLLDIETLVDAINKAIFAQNSKNQNSSIDVNMVNTELSRLKIAMINYDISTINEAAKILQSFIQTAGLDDQIVPVIKKILQCKLIGEYDEAVSIIDGFLTEKNFK